MEERIVQITSGKGPEECERAVFLVWEKMLKQAQKLKLEIEIMELIAGKYENTYLSATFKMKGEALDEFCREWKGTIQWVSQSPYRKFHKRKNWFIGVSINEIPKQNVWDEKDFSFQTLRASGPGGQNVNKVETAVRAIHNASGLSLTSSNERSQIQNKKTAIGRLKNKLIANDLSEENRKQHGKWIELNELERGNAVRVLREGL